MIRYKELTDDETKLRDKMKVVDDERTILYTKAGNLGDQRKKMEKEFERMVKARLLAELRVKIKTLPRKLKNGDRVTYSIQRKCGYVGGVFIYNLPYIEKKVTRKPSREESDEIAKDIGRMAEKIGYRLVRR